MPTHVRDEGSPRARIVLVGEAPGKHEELLGRPFVGPSGNKLAVWWRGVGLSRADFYITNVLPYRPENIDKIPKEELEHWIAELHERLAKLEGPVVIVPTGNYALYALTGKGKVSWNRKDGRSERPGIMDWRGSILSWNGIKVIPTIHPAHILRTPSLERRALKDWARIAAELDDPALWLPVRDHRIKPTIEDVELFVNDALATGKPVALDIETPKGRITEFQLLDGTWSRKVKRTELDLVARYKSGKKKGQPKSRTRPGYAYLGCIGFSYDPSFSLTIPLTLEYWKSKERLAEAKRQVQRLLSSGLPLVMQNGMFDSLWLLREGYEVVNWIWDTRAMHHALDPRDDHDLAYMASVLTRQPFWKHEAKDPEEITKYATNSEALWTYNGIDVCVTLEIFYELRKRLAAEGQLDFYRRHYSRLMPILLDMTLHGVEIDETARQGNLDILDATAASLARDLEVAAGMPLIAKRGLSNDRLKFFFYGKSGLTDAKYAKLKAEYPDALPLDLRPVYKKNQQGGRSITVDEVTIRKLILKYPKNSTLAFIGPKLLEYRRNRKMAEFLDKATIDKDGRIRCQYSFVTEAGRLASQAVPWGVGRNLQNIDRELRYVFVPDREKDDGKGKDTV
jgi:uracil-DNA glycosylase family 4